ncbi:hypothetical protein [Actinoplanes sp. NPDC026623]|uniref:hypothetical protein n=1 Tax=Actinoplanes sp. NPDC026623 TaxID=3155610 RepID=UPI0033D8ECDA
MADVGGRLTRWRPRLGTGRATFAFRFEPTILRRLPGAPASRTVRLERHVHETRLLCVRLPGPAGRLPAVAPAAAVLAPQRRDPTLPAAPRPVPPAAQTRLVCRTVQERVERLRPVITRHIVQSGAAGPRAIARVTVPQRSRRRPAPMVIHAERARPAPAAPPPAPAAEAGPPAQVPIVTLSPPVAGPAAPAVDLDLLVAQVLRRIERRALAQRERLGRS